MAADTKSGPLSAPWMAAWPTCLQVWWARPLTGKRVEGGSWVVLLSSDPEAGRIHSPLCVDSARGRCGDRGRP